MLKDNTKQRYFMAIMALLAVLALALSGLLLYSTTVVGHYHFASQHMDHMAGIYGQNHSQTPIGSRRESFIDVKESIFGELVAQGDYACCLARPCSYCIEKTPEHGAGAACSCLADVVNGLHPCGECIGEILEGHGNKFLAKYFARALSEEIGSDYYETLKSVIYDKYGVSPQEQI